MNETEIKSWSRTELDTHVRALIDQGNQSKAMKVIEIAFDHDFIEIMSYAQDLV